MGGCIDDPVLVVAPYHHRGHAHIEIGIGLALRVHSRIAVHQAGNQIFPRAVDHPRAFGDQYCSAVTHLDDASVTYNDDRILQVSCRAAPVGHVHHGAAGENQRNRGLRFRKTRIRRLCPGQHCGQDRSTHAQQKNTKLSHIKISLLWIVAQRFSLRTNLPHKQAA